VKLMSDATPQSESRSFSRHWIVLGLLVVAQTGIGAYFNGQIDMRGNGWLLTIGLLFSQPILLAFWAAFAPQPFYQRFLWSFLLCTVVSFFEQLNALDAQNVVKGIIMMMFLAIFIVATIVFLAFRWVFRWQIKHTLIENVPSDYQRGQFGIKHLIILITVSALCCGLIRSLCVINRNWHSDEPIVQSVGRACAMLFLVLPVTVVPWIVMSHRPKVVRSLLAMISVEIVCAVSGGYIISLCFSTYLSLSSVFVREGRAMLIIQLGAGLSVLISTIVMRFCGFRMVRVPKASPR